MGAVISFFIGLSVGACFGVMCLAVLIAGKYTNEDREEDE